MLKDLEIWNKQKLPKVVIAGFEPDLNAVAQPIQLRSQQHQQSRKPSSQKTSSGNTNSSRGKPPAKRSSPPKKSFSR